MWLIDVEPRRSRRNNVFEGRAVAVVRQREPASSIGLDIPMPKYLIEPSAIPTTVIADLDAVRKRNQQRFEMEQLTAITLCDVAELQIAGYKDLAEDEFWIKGHLPGLPLMPGVLMCEAAAQLCSYFCHVADLVKEGEFLGFGGMEDVKFRGVVRPGQRLILVGQAQRKQLARRMKFDVQGFVGEQLVFECVIVGIPIKASSVRGDAATEEAEA
jgi:3-hydroxyacyl-[acyl-carrier-protein] dehydratase